MFKRTMRKLSGLKNRASWSWGHSWLRPDRLQVIKAIFVVHPVPTQRFYQPSETNSMWCFCVSSRAGGSSEICEAFPDFHQQSQGGPAGSLSAGSLSGHGGSNGAGSWAVSWMHWVGQGREENLPTTGSGGKEVLNKLVGAIKRHKRNLILCMIFFLAEFAVGKDLDFKSFCTNSQHSSYVVQGQSSVLLLMPWLLMR